MLENLLWPPLRVNQIHHGSAKFMPLWRDLRVSFPLSTGTLNQTPAFPASPSLICTQAIITDSRHHRPFPDLAHLRAHDRPIPAARLLHHHGKATSPGNEDNLIEPRSICNKLQSMTPVQAVLFDYGMVLSGPPDPAAWARMLAPSPTSAKNNSTANTGPTATPTTAATSPPNPSGHRAAAPTHAIVTPSQLAALIAADVDYWSTLNPPMLAWARISSKPASPPASSPTCPTPWRAVSAPATTGSTTSLTTPGPTHSTSPNPNPPSTSTPPKASSTPPENILFIDDKAENIAAAHALGMQAIQYTTHNAFEHEMRPRNLDHLLQLEGHTASQNGKL